jgi:ATP-dependent helicase YprA (DUF1998 family)
MEALVLEERDRLGLNIVCEEVQKAPKRKKDRKQNKYEKRRAKARQAKGQAEKTKSEDVAPISPSILTVHPGEKHQEMNDKSIESEPTAMEIPERSTQPVDVESSPPRQSRKVHFDALQDKQERARYMAEFHARPMEMDRRCGAVSRIAPSRESTHIFDEHAWKGLHPRITSSLSKLGMERPTVIQTRAMNALKGIKRHNLFIQSETGSGKTLAFLLPILQVSNLTKPRRLK